MFLKAIKGTGGVLTAIALRLKVSRKTVYDWLACPENKRYKENILDERETIIDLAEGSLFSHVKNKEPWATKYTLATIGKNRGYIETIKQEVTSDNNITYTDFIEANEEINDEKKQI